MPRGKPAGIPCVQLTDDFACALFGHRDRPEICGRLRPTPTMCGVDRWQALAGLDRLEVLTRPAGA